VAAGRECFILVKDGRSVAALIDIDEFEDYLELNDPEVRAAIAEGWEDYLAGRTRPAEERCCASCKRWTTGSAGRRARLAD
jgi:hypothetical protein